MTHMIRGADGCSLACPGCAGPIFGRANPDWSEGEEDTCACGLHFVIGVTDGPIQCLEVIATNRGSMDAPNCRWCGVALPVRTGGIMIRIDECRACRALNRCRRCGERMPETPAGQIVRPHECGSTKRTQSEES